MNIAPRRISNGHLQIAGCTYCNRAPSHLCIQYLKNPMTRYLFGFPLVRCRVWSDRSHRLDRIRFEMRLETVSFEYFLDSSNQAAPRLSNRSPTTRAWAQALAI